MSDTKREAITDIAAQTFIELGYERASMSEISARVGGSKATLYRYFDSKEALFVAATQRTAERHVTPAFDALRHSDDVARELQTFGSRLAAIFASPETAAILRMVIAEATNSDIGRLFHASGPAQGNAMLADYLAVAMRNGALRKANPHHAAVQLLALMDAETSERRLYALPGTSLSETRRSVRRGIDIFLLAYAPDAKTATAKARSLRPAPAVD